LFVTNVAPQTTIDRARSRPYHPSVQPVISAEQMRQIDRLTVQDFRVPSRQLMQAAAEACFQAISNHFFGKLADARIQILCGPGNNGGDGAVLAQELSRAGAHIDVVLFGQVDQTRGDARTNFDIVRRLAADGESQLTFVECGGAAAWKELPKPGYDIVVDALFGTGLSRPLEGVFSDVVQHLVWMRRQPEIDSPPAPQIVSVDIPSGLNADLAIPFGDAVEADMTVTFTAPKPANVLPPASHLNGKLIVADIGSPLSLVEAVGSNLFITEQSDARAWLIKTRYTPDSFKNTHGHVLVVAGSRGYTGAAVLCGNAAMKSGAGLVTIATPASAQSSIAASVMPEVMTTALAETDRGAVSDEAVDHVMRLASKSTVIAIGPGLSAEDERTRRFVYSIVKERKTPIVIDADALNSLASYAGRGWPKDLFGSKQHPIVLTPHPGEMLRLLGTDDKASLGDRVSVVREFATKHKVIVVLKGSRPLIAAPDRRVFVNPTGNAGLGTAGAGDTLTGIIAGFIAQEVATLKDDADILSATIAALYIGGLAGDFAARKLGMRTMVASDIREHLSEAILSLDAKGEQP
jgi:ADP-dependent NAD(P)H-hydrate dehydratase / NAD(P)H-hydrate epimerase